MIAPRPPRTRRDVFWGGVCVGAIGAGFVIVVGDALWGWLT